MCSNIGDDFNLVDIINPRDTFSFSKGVDVEKLFIDDGQRNVKRVDELGSLLQKESGLKREYAKNAPTRHGRFGTMVWVKRDDQKVSRYQDRIFSRMITGKQHYLRWTK